MPKACVVAEYGSLNGGENSLLAVIGNLQKAGWEFSVIAPSPSQLSDALKHQSTEVIPFDYWDPQGIRKPLDRIRHEIGLLIREQKPQLVHANSLSTSRIVGPVTKQLGVASIGHIRDIIGLSRQMVADLSCVDRLIAVSHATRSFHIEQGLPADRTFVVHNGVDLDQFKPRQKTSWLHRELQIPSHLRLILSIGQIGIRKGIDVTLDAAEMILTDRDDIAFLFVGERHSQKDEAIEYESKLIDRSSQPPLCNHVFWLGRRTDIPAIMNEVDFVVHSARQEPLGRVLLEAFASGTPAIATDVGGTREVFVDKSLQELVVPPDDPSSLCRAIIKWINHDSVQSLSTKVRGIAEQHFSAEQSAAALLKHYSTKTSNE